MQTYEGIVQDLIDNLGRLPGIGPKSAQRLAFFLIDAPSSQVESLAEVLLRVKSGIAFCTICYNVAETDTCRICSDNRRDLHSICVVEESKDVLAIERTREFFGRYHVLGGALSPLDGIGPADLRVTELMQRLSELQDSQPVVQEVIIATNPNHSGEATAAFLARTIGPLGITVTRLASGLPVGGDLEYADEVTLGRAFAGRRRLTD